MKVLSPSTALSMSMILALCGVSCKYASEEDLGKVAETTAQVEAESKTQAQRLEELSKRVAELEGKHLFEEVFGDPYSKATFDPAADEGFSRLDTSTASFAVSVQAIKPYADGSRVVLNVGNLSSARVNGATFKVTWGVRRPVATGDDVVASYTTWRGSLHEREIKTTKSLEPGTWNRVEISLPGVPPDQLGYLELAMETSEISLVSGR